MTGLSRPRGLPDQPAPSPLAGPLALALVGVMVLLLVAGGVGLDRLVHPGPSGVFAGCRTAAELGPRYYLGPPPRCIDPHRAYAATVVTTKGQFSLALLPGAAPTTVNNFIVLAVNGYYDGLGFFKAQDWYIQGGDPQNNGHGGPGYALPAEPAAAHQPWRPGDLGMARLPDGSLSGSQFFVLRQAWPGGQPPVNYNRFATITEGSAVVSQLGTSDRIVQVKISGS